MQMQALAQAQGKENFDLHACPYACIQAILTVKLGLFCLCLCLPSPGGGGGGVLRYTYMYILSDGDVQSPFLGLKFAI